MSKKLRVLMIADIAGEGKEYHVGDEAMAEVAISRIKEIVGQHNLVMACAHPHGIPATYGIKATAYHSLPAEKRKSLPYRRPHSYLKALFKLMYNLIWCDVLFVCGGGNLTSEWIGVLESRLHLIAMAKKFGKKVILVSQTLGPFTDEHRRQCNKILADVEWIGVRDKHFSHTQIDHLVHYAVDDACFLQPKHSTQTKLAADNNKPFIALSMRKFGTANESLLSLLAQEVAGIAEKNKLKTIFIPHHSPGGDGGDTKIANENSLFWSSENPLFIVDPIPLASALKALTGEGACTISMRYHEIIFSLAMGIPVIGIYVNEYTQAKLHGAFEQFGLAPRIISIEDVTDKLESLFEKTISEKSIFLKAAKNVQDNELPINMKPYNLLKQLASKN